MRWADKVREHMAEVHEVEWDEGVIISGDFEDISVVATWGFNLEIMSGNR